MDYLISCASIIFFLVLWFVSGLIYDFYVKPKLDKAPDWIARTDQPGDENVYTIIILFVLIFIFAGVGWLFDAW